MDSGFFGIAGHNRAWYGDYKLTGVVKENGLPVSRRVVLFEFPSGCRIATTFSNATTGVYLFDNITEKPSGGAVWGVMAIDHTGAFDPVAKIQITVTKKYP